MEEQFICVCHGDEWASEALLMDHQVCYHASEARRYQQMYEEIRSLVMIHRRTLENVVHQNNVLKRKQRWIQRKEKELENKYYANRLREANTRRIRRHLRQRTLELEDREARFITDE